MLFLFILAGLLGLIVGSFLTAFLPRLAAGEGVIRGRSHCVHCGKALSALELVPVISFLIQGGRCRSCHRPIPRSYPALELVTGALFSFAAWGAANASLPVPAFLPGNGFLLFFYYAFFAASAVAVSAYDLAHRLIPAVLILSLAALGALAQVVGAVRSGDVRMLLGAGAFGLTAFLFFWALWFFSRGRAMGRGDADVALAIALYLGPAVAAPGILFAFWIGALYGIVGVIAGRLTRKSAIPFSPFLFAGAIIALFLSQYLTVLLPFSLWV